MAISTTTQVLSFTGALLILIAYVGHQFKLVDGGGKAYNVLNAAGSAILGYIALRPFQLGFTVLEWTWAGVSVYALWRAVRSRTLAQDSRSAG